MDKGTTWVMLEVDSFTEGGKGKRVRESERRRKYPWGLGQDETCKTEIPKRVNGREEGRVQI